MPTGPFPSLAAGVDEKFPDPPADRTAAPDSCHLRGRRILVVEDDCMLAMDIEEALGAAGATVVGPAPSLSRAFDAVVPGGLDGAILDVKLRQETVFPLADRLRELGVRFVLVTGVDASDLPPRYAQAPRCAKPLDMGRAVAALGRLIGS